MLWQLPLDDTICSAVAAVIVVVGLTYFVRHTWSLIVGGPRTGLDGKNRPLRDRLSYFLDIVAIFGWTSFAFTFLLGMLVVRHSGSMPLFFQAGFMLVTMGLLYLIRGDIMADNAAHLAHSAPMPWRWFSRFQTYFMSYSGPSGPRRIWPVIHMAVGLLVLAFTNYKQLPDSLAQYPGVVAMAARVILTSFGIEPWF